MSTMTMPEGTVTLDWTTTAATQAEGRPANADVTVPGWHREAACPQ
jgi:hypothetical protein